MTKPTRHHTFFDIISSDKRIRETLQELGFFIKDYIKGDAIPNQLWYDWGYTDEDMSFDHSWIDRIHPEDKAQVMRHATDIVEEGSCNTCRNTYRFRKKDGSYAWVISSGKFISFDENGTPEIYVGADIDVTKMKETEQALIDARKKAEKLALESETLLQIGKVISSSLELEETASMVFKQLKKLIPHDVSMLSILNRDALEIINVNEESPTCHGADLIGQKILVDDNKSFSAFIIAFQKPLMCNDIQREFPNFKHMYTAPEFQSIIGVPLLSKGKTIGLFSIAAFHKHAFSSEEYETLSKFSDNIAIAVDNAILHEKMAAMARTDALTGLHNRNGLSLHWQVIFEQANRYERDISLILADIDHFKNINDTFGHDVGDQVLKSVAKCIQENTRATDQVARFGGEEFVIILPETDKLAALNMAEKLRASVESMTLEGPSEKVTISIGVTSAKPGEHSDLNAWIKAADDCLYQAKNSGRNQVCGNT